MAGALGTKAIGSLHEFGRCVSDLEHRARQTTGRRGCQGACCSDWLKDIGYEQHLHDSEDSEKLASRALEQRARLRRLGGAALRRRDHATTAAQFESERQSVLQVAQTISVIISLAERGDDTDTVTLSTAARRQGPGMGAMCSWPA